jgi:hypothetical protein
MISLFSVIGIFKADVADGRYELLSRIDSVSVMTQFHAASFPFREQEGYEVVVETRLTFLRRPAPLELRSRRLEPNS